MHKLQRAQNTAARIVSRTSRCSHITPVLKELHWLPLKYRVQYKTLTFTYKALHEQSPDYIRDMLKVYKPSRTLRSQDSLSLVVPNARTVMFGNRSFAYAAPALWNALPIHIKSATSLMTFKSLLKNPFLPASLQWLIIRLEPIKLHLALGLDLDLVEFWLSAVPWSIIIRAF